MPEKPQSTQPESSDMTLGKVHPLISRLKSETVMGSPTICEEEWDCIEGIIRDEMNLPSDLLDLNAICKQRDALAHELGDIKEAVRAMVAAKGRYNTQKAMEHLISIVTPSSISRVD